MNNICLTKENYSVVNAIPRFYTLVHHTAEDKPLIAIAWEGCGRYFVRLYTHTVNETENDFLGFVNSWNAPTKEEAIRMADRLANGQTAR